MANWDLETAAGIQEGDVLAEKYRVDKVLGAGGMGMVVAARHLQLETRVAIKFLLPALAKNEEALARFAREARAAVKITGEHVARVLDVGTFPNGAPYMVMEFLEGVDLGAWLRQHGPLPVEQAVDFVLQACVAIAEAHSLGIVHRDLKPANLFCIRRADGQLFVKVLDFGISKELASIGPNRAATQTSALMGSPFYMSPEQMMSAKDVDARTDIWALGIILHELVTGSGPFPGDTIPEICTRVATTSPTTLRSARPDAPAALEAVILKCLEKNRAARYANVGELAAALVGLAPARSGVLVNAIFGIVQSAGHTVAIPASGVMVNAPGHVETQTSAAGSIPGYTKGGGKSRKGWVWFGVAVAAILAAVTVVGLVLVRFGPASSRAEPASSAPATAAHQVAAPQEPRAPEPAEEQQVPSTVPEEVTPRTRAADDAPLPVHPTPVPVAPTQPPRRTRPMIAGPRTAASTVNAPLSPRAAPPHAPAGANCDPPFFFDDQGNRVFKRECVN